MRRARLFGAERTLDRTGCDGFSFIPAKPGHSDGIGPGQVLEPEDLQAYSRPDGCGLALVGRGTRPLPGCIARRQQGAVQSQAGDCADRLRSRYLRRGQCLYRTDFRPISTPTRRCPVRFTVRNRHLQALLPSADATMPPPGLRFWKHEGSVQHLDCLDEYEKAAYRTAFEIDQRWIIELAARPGSDDLPEPVAQPVSAGDIDKWICTCCTGRPGSAASRACTTVVPSSLSRAGFAGQLDAAHSDSVKAGSPTTRSAWHVSN